MALALVAILAITTSSCSNAESTQVDVDSYVAAVSPADSGKCQVKDARTKKTQPNNVGFPHSKDLIPVSGSFKTITIPVHFSDLPGTPEFMDLMNNQFIKMSEWYSFFSQGKVSAEFDFGKKWYRAKYSSKEYNTGMAQPNERNPYANNMNRMAQEWIDTAGKDFDFTDVVGVHFYFPANYQGNIVSGILGRGVNLNTPQGRKLLYFDSPGTYTYNLERKLFKQDSNWYGYWVHEILHSQGLPLHAPGNGFNTGVGQQQEGYSLVLDAWETFLAGWFEENQVFCAPAEDLTQITTDLVPLEVAEDGYKVAIVPFSDTEAIVIESRRPLGYSDGWTPSEKGLLVYRIDTRNDNDRSAEDNNESGNDPNFPKWGFYLLPKGNTAQTAQSFNQYIDYILYEGNSVTYSDIEVKLLKTGDVDRVQITKLSSSEN